MMKLDAINGYQLFFIPVDELDYKPASSSLLEASMNSNTLASVYDNITIRVYIDE